MDWWLLLISFCQGVGLDGELLWVRNGSGNVRCDFCVCEGLSSLQIRIDCHGSGLAFHNGIRLQDFRACLFIDINIAMKLNMLLLATYLHISY